MGHAVSLIPKTDANTGEGALFLTTAPPSRVARTPPDRKGTGGENNRRSDDISVASHEGAEPLRAAVAGPAMALAVGGPWLLDSGSTFDLIDRDRLGEKHWERSRKRRRQQQC